MSTLFEVNPDSFIDKSTQSPAFGRGAWAKSGIGFDYRYMVSPSVETRIGTLAEVSLSHWAVAAGSWAIQQRLIELGFLAPVDDSERGIFGLKTKAAVIAFQKANVDPDGGRQLDADGTVGKSDARALFTPAILTAEKTYGIPNRLLVGETNFESMLDPGAVGYYIYYPDYRGVDRGMSQINGLSNSQVSWLQAFNPAFSADWSGARLRSFFDRYHVAYPRQSVSSLWDAAICAHNNPSAAGVWAATGIAPTAAAAKYVAGVKNAIY